MPLEETLRAGEILLPEEACVLPLEQCTADARAEGVADLITGDCSEETGQDEPADVEESLRGEKPSGKQQGITGQEQTDEKATFREHDRCDAERADRTDDGDEVDPEQPSLLIA